MHLTHKFRMGRAFLLPVNEPPPHAAFEEAAAAVAGVDAVVFPAAGVSAHFADQSRAQRFARGRTLGCESNRTGRLVPFMEPGIVSHMCLPSALSAQSACSSTHTSQYCNSLKISFSG